MQGKFRCANVLAPAGDLPQLAGKSDGSKKKEEDVEINTLACKHQADSCRIKEVGGKQGLS